MCIVHVGCLDPHTCGELVSVEAEEAVVDLRALATTEELAEVAEVKREEEEEEDFEVSCASSTCAGVVTGSLGGT